MKKDEIGTKARLIIVEDEALVAKELTIRLNRMNYNVVATCVSPEDALEKALTESPDLILMDINLNANKDGIDVAAEIHQHQDTPVIFCTAYSSNDVLARAKITEPYGYILKPVDSRELEISIEIALYKHKIEHELHDTNNKLLVTLNSIEDAVIACDPQGRIFLANPKAIELCKLDKTPIGRSVGDILCFEELGTNVKNVDIGHWLSEKLTCHHQKNYQLRRYIGNPVPVELHVSPLEGINGQYNGLVFALRDITRRIYFEQQLRKNAFQDPITQLPDRSMMLERIKLAIKRKIMDDNYNFSVIFIDLDRFRIINDGLNHEFGDEVLRQVSRKIISNIRDIDMLTRFSSDTFVCLIEDVESVPVIISIVNKIHRDIAKPIVINTHQIALTASSGIALSNENISDYSDYSEVLRDADTAMYQAKLRGGDTHVIFDEKMHDYALRLLQIENALQNAMANGDIHIYYQPIIDSNTHKIASFEALVRWKDKQKGLISPNEFIPLAEDTGLILPLGEYIFDAVCKQLFEWQKVYGFEVKVGVNLSARQFSQTGLTDIIKNYVYKYGLNSSCLNVEVTETMTMKDVKETISVLNSLQEIGIQVSLDDFGTGYSSLSYLKQFPIQTLKIDRSFIKDIVHNGDDQAIVRAIIAMAQELHFDTLAEGIETKSQAQMLHQLGCNYFQGFYFSKPKDATETTQLLQNIHKEITPALSAIPL